MPALRAARVLAKLLPSILALRQDRRRWVRTEGKEADHTRYQKNAQRLLKTCIDLGPVFIKLGQWLSSRADILPQPYLAELAKLQDSVPAAPFEQVRPMIENDLGRIGDRFDAIDTNPISGASLGQVYRGSIAGQQIVVKVKRPGIEEMVRKDIAVMKKILPLALRFVDPNLRFSARAVLAQFIETIREEMDYTIESENLKNIKRDMQANPAVIVPAVYDGHSSKNVLTMEYLPGVKITNVDELDGLGIDRQQLVVDVHKVFFTMLLRHSVFHADPHPGNISVTPDGRLILYDYGMVGRLDSETRLRLVRLYLALVEKDPSRTVNAMEQLGMLTPDFNRSVIEKGIELTVRAMHGAKPDEMEVQSLMELANKTMGRFPFVLPKNLALYMRMASIIEGIYKQHDVDFKFVRVLREILEEERLIKDAYVGELRYAIKRLAKSLDAALSIAPDLKRLIDDNRSLQMRARTRQSPLLPGSILSSAVFVGSAVLFLSDVTLGVAGMACSAATMAVTAVYARR